MIVVELPFPPKELSPNSRLHWAAVSKAKKAYRSACYAVLISRPAKWTFEPAADSKLTIGLTFYPPNRRSYDWDNLVARMKAGIDGIADGLGIDDKNFRIGSIDLAPPVKGGMVRVRIEEVV